MSPSKVGNTYILQPLSRTPEFLLLYKTVLEHCNQLCVVQSTMKSHIEVSNHTNKPRKIRKRGIVLLALKQVIGIMKTTKVDFLYMLQKLQIAFYFENNSNLFVNGDNGIGFTLQTALKNSMSHFQWYIKVWCIGVPILWFYDVFYIYDITPKIHRQICKYSFFEIKTIGKTN